MISTLQQTNTQHPYIIASSITTITFSKDIGKSYNLELLNAPIIATCFSLNAYCYYYDYAKSMIISSWSSTGNFTLYTCYEQPTTCIHMIEGHSVVNVLDIKLAQLQVTSTCYN